MGVKLVTTQKQLDEMTIELYKIVRDEVMRALQYLGEESITKIRDRSAEESWIDDTGNLRSSIGYAVYDHAEIEVESAFEVVGQGAKGSSEGKRMITELAKLYAKVYALVVVAAMNYAEYVEAKDNKDVLASTELWARSKVDSYMKKALERAMIKINKIVQ